MNSALLLMRGAAVALVATSLFLIHFIAGGMLLHTHYTGLSYVVGRDLLASSMQAVKLPGVDIDAPGTA